MSLASVFRPLPAYRSGAGLARSLMSSYGPDGGAQPHPPAAAAPGTSPQGPRSSATLPYDEFGGNQSAPLQVGQPPAGGWPSATPTSSGGGGGGGGGGGAPINFDDDPILARIRAYNQQQIANAESAALAQRKQAEIGYGYDPSIKYEDASTQEAARQNAFSTLAQLLFQHGERGHALDESLNKSNLFYSGERGRQLGLEGRQYTGEQVQANSGLQQQMQQILQMVLGVKNDAQQRELQGEEDAYNRALQFALANGTGGGGGGGGGNGGLENPNQFGGGDEITSAANAYAAAHPGYNPHMVMQEGVQVHDGRRGVWVKFTTPAGDSTEWVDLGPA